MVGYGGNRKAIWAVKKKNKKKMVRACTTYYQEYTGKNNITITRVLLHSGHFNNTFYELAMFLITLFSSFPVILLT